MSASFLSAPSAAAANRPAIVVFGLLWFVGQALFAGRVPAQATDGSVTVDAPAVDFNADIRPILSSRCLTCHGPDEAERAAGLRLDTEAGSREDLGGYAAVVPGDPDASELMLRLTSDDETMRMPPADKGPPLSDDEISLVRRWIEQGASYDLHWAYQPPRRPALPAVGDAAWPRNAIDRFVLARLEAEGLSPEPEADRWTLARRVALDLTGLPPTPEQARAFVDDPRPDAYERYVDALLAHPAFGERWARVWLDLARYADSAGYADDPPRTIWAYRDYVIRSLNGGKPFDQFTIEQIAGDLLESPTEEQWIATAFHRNTLTNNEGGTNDEEFRNVAVVDRVNTTMSVWMGTTMACAQCHTHKYDPITLEEYFRFFAFFNQSEDSDKRDERPLLELWDEETQRQRQELQGRIASLREQAEAKGDPEGQDAQEPSAGQQELERLQKRLAELRPRTTVPIMRDLPEDKRRETRVQLRGNYQSTGQLVEPGVPEVFHPLPQDAAPDRLALARWLVDGQNPLTARVIANRHWEQLFGAGLVLTSEEYGSQGDPPSHPGLLDWLALELREQGWDTKRLLRQVVLSATYRQDSAVSPEKWAADSANRLLARGPRFRVSAETVRDQALAAGGLLSGKMLGPSVNPPQPQMGLKAAFGSATDWTTSGGADRYRRGLYTTWRRSNPYPSMATFDAPNREVCEVRRGRTNTPLQALVTLNDPVYVEAAIALAGRMYGRGPSDRERMTHGFRRALVRPPTEAELDRLLTLLAEARTRFAGDVDAAAELVGVAAAGVTAPGTDVDAAELASWTLVANVLLNLDELFLRP